MKIPKDADAVAPMADSDEEITQAFHKLKDRVRVEGPQQVDDSSDSEGSSNAVAPDRSKDKAADKKFAAELCSMDSLTRLSLPKPTSQKKRKVRKPAIVKKARSNGTDFFIGDGDVRIGFASVWGASLQNTRIECKHKGHSSCRVTCASRKVPPVDALVAWLQTAADFKTPGQLAEAFKRLLLA